jgi:hypothetical protein
MGSIWVSLILLSLTDEETLWIESCRNKMVGLSELFLFLSLTMQNPLSDSIDATSDDTSNWLMSADWSSW